MTLNIQLLSDLHMEVEDFVPSPAPQADLLVLAGDIDTTWQGLNKFSNWPVPVLYVTGNHEFDGRDIAQAYPQLRALCSSLNIHLLEQQAWFHPRFPQIRFLGCNRWCDFDLLGKHDRERCMRAAKFHLRQSGTLYEGQPLDAERVRSFALEAHYWLAQQLAERRGLHNVVITHFAPSRLSADPRYGLQPGTAGFCNNDDDLIKQASLWLHGHLHCPSDYTVGDTRVVANPRGYRRKEEDFAFDPLKVVELPFLPIGQ